MTRQTTPSKTSHDQGQTPGLSPKAQPHLRERGPVIQQAGTVRLMPISLAAETREFHAQQLNQVLVDTITLYNMYKKHHWQVSGPTFYQIHLLFDKHAAEQLELVDLLAERVQTLGGVAIGMPHDVAEMTRIERPPQGVETVPVMIDRLLEAHEQIISFVREFAQKANDRGDLGTNDLLVSDVLRTNELQVWFLAEHVTTAPAGPPPDSRR